MGLKFLEKYKGEIYAVTRIVIGFLYSLHGAQKLFGLFGGSPGEMPAALFYSAGVLEFLGGVLIAVGFQTRWAAFISSGTMAVAYFMVHQANGALPIQNHGELSVLYCWIFLMMASQGDGKWSLAGFTKK